MRLDNLDANTKYPEFTVSFQSIGPGTGWYARSDMD